MDAIGQAMNFDLSSLVKMYVPIKEAFLLCP